MSEIRRHRIQRILDRSQLDTDGFLQRYTFATHADGFIISLMEGLDASLTKSAYITTEYRLVIYNRRDNVRNPQRTLTECEGTQHAFRCLLRVIREAKRKWGDELEEVPTR